MYASYNYIPLIPFKLGRYAAWATYGYFQGQQMTGIWVCEIAPTSQHQVTEYGLRSLVTNVGTVDSPRMTT